MGTNPTTPQPLISWALACLLYTLITYTALEAMSGEALHVSLLSLSVTTTLYLTLPLF